MSDSKMREEFEAVLKEKWPAIRMSRFDKPGSPVDGEYSNDIVQAYWWGWKASRAAAVVELPACEVDVDPDIEDYEEMEQQEAFSMLEHHVLRRCRKAIEAAGLKVKQ